MSKIVFHGQEARSRILAGVDFLADVVKVTEGPRGRNIILGQRALGQSPRITRDGVTVSNYVDPPDITEQMGADLIREAAQKTDNAVGDGTTASIVIAQAMIHAGFEKIEGIVPEERQAEYAQQMDDATFSPAISVARFPAVIAQIKKRLTFCANPLAMERGIHKAVDAVVKQLKFKCSETTPERRSLSLRMKSLSLPVS